MVLKAESIHGFLNVRLKLLTALFLAAKVPCFDVEVAVMVTI